MSYEVYLKRSAEKELGGLPVKIHDNIVNQLISLQINPRPRGVKKLKKQKEEYRIRIGQYRAVYVIDDSNKKIEVFSVAHRKDVYR